MGVQHFGVVGGLVVDLDFLDVFVQGGDDRIYENGRPNGFSGWSEVPGDGLTISEPAAVFDRGSTKLFIRDISDRILENDLDGTGWSEISGGALTPSAPAAVVATLPFGTPFLYLTSEDGRILEGSLV